MKFVDSLHVTEIVKKIYEIRSFLNHHAPFVLPLGKEGVDFQFRVLLPTAVSTTKSLSANSETDDFNDQDDYRTLKSQPIIVSETSPFCETKYAVSCLVMQLCWRYSRAQELSQMEKRLSWGLITTIIRCSLGFLEILWFGAAQTSSQNSA